MLIREASSPFSSASSSHRLPQQSTDRLRMLLLSTGESRGVLTVADFALDPGPKGLPLILTPSIIVGRALLP
eukprot:2226938-Rhodomonas_salina.2